MTSFAGRGGGDRGVWRAAGTPVQSLSLSLWGEKVQERVCECELEALDSRNILPGLARGGGGGSGGVTREMGKGSPRPDFLGRVREKGKETSLIKGGCDAGRNHAIDAMLITLFDQNTAATRCGRTGYVVQAGRNEQNW